jgi:hypothetical protein
MNIRARYLATTLVLIAIGAGYVLMPEWPGRRAPRLAAPADASAHRQMLPAPLTAREILDRADLTLTAEQRGRLESLDRRWREETAGVGHELKEAEEEFSRFLADAQAKGGVSVLEIQRRSEEVRRLGAVLRQERKQHSKAAVQILAKIQRGAPLASSMPNASGGER